MARKELSPYAPDRWIRELNRRYPSLWNDLRERVNALIQSGDFFAQERAV